MEATMTQSGNQIDWKTVIRRIKAGKCTPIISYRVSARHFSDNEAAVRAWADELGYPLADGHNLARVAQYASSIRPDPLSAKEEYLDFLKKRLLDRFRAEQPPDQTDYFLATLEAELFDLSFSEFASRLGYPEYASDLDDPLRILAELPIPVYLTTNFASFMEVALKAAGKEPRVEVCCWCEDVEADALSVFREDPEYKPSPEEPLVYHIHGLDADPCSLVLTEDDYLDYLFNVAQDPETIPNRVAMALADTSLILLGYNLQDWDFRVVFRGLIASRRSSRRLMSLSIQLTPDPQGVENLADAQEYLERYFEAANFEIYWGDVQSFMKALWEQWES
jgi:hypothetical protein